ncbi:MAG TPA: cyanophycin synthetase, partial [bacterium]|nr:cyanophycin synthetase [bacterium]
SIDGFGIFNRDNDFQNILKQKGVFLKTVGFGPLCNFRGFITSYNTDSFNLQVNGWENVNFRINSWNGAIAYPALFSLFIAEYFGIPKSHLPSLVNNFVLINGRGKMRIVDGVKIFDESYNANPGSLKTALRYFALQKAKRKIVVIGAMGELGKWSRFYHKKLGDMIQKLDFDFVFTIGEDACIISKLVKKKGMHFDNLQEMTEYISGFVKAGDAVLVKGSRMNNLDLLVEHLVEKTGIK